MVGRRTHESVVRKAFAVGRESRRREDRMNRGGTRTVEPADGRGETERNKSRQHEGTNESRWLGKRTKHD
jgi:hypothetical protein